jgi:hypothetical protein
MVTELVDVFYSGADANPTEGAVPAPPATSPACVPPHPSQDQALVGSPER